MTNEVSLQFEAADGQKPDEEYCLRVANTKASDDLIIPAFSLLECTKGGRLGAREGMKNIKALVGEGFEGGGFFIRASGERYD